ncbi:transcription factor tfiiic complex b box binding subunit sfc3 [Schizosaccharomyces japonicus yFS275]|uniref:Transcription factor tfiiic complex b box binding subunit sfc3 n=1 Tax=Schizosaccharomyces japonicus (strain yFS275 / FY16936) TaxID=402676 RepID=B6K193_SCHJY|nr:transcription factor tfiiic complex b box binding subunit sfc3 [Schizosaccharomyces japonicus yFS275]EEB07714.2 transcription factor tfiiic complex b box binding subunit sfc3 [Schizosaccharomyces japonicus yFS275]
MDLLVRHCSEEIALDGTSGCHVDRLWFFAERFYAKQGIVQNIDEDFKAFLWPFILRQDGIEVWIQHPKTTAASLITDITENYRAITEDEKRQLVLRASEDRQWLTLTYKTKEDSKVQPLAFELLSCISKHREEGVDRIQLCKEAGQEARSVYGRIQALEDAGLISKIAIHKNKNLTALLVLKRFENENKTLRDTVAQVSGKPIYNTEKIRKDICDIVGSQKNGICRHVDACRLVNLSNNKWERKYFARQVRNLYRDGYVKKCLSQSRNSDRSVRCIQFIRSYIPHSSNVPESQISDDDLEGEDDVEEDESLFDTKSEIDASTIQDVTELPQWMPMWIRFQSVEYQCYRTIRDQGTRGALTLHLLNTLTGENYVKPLSKMLEALVDNVAYVPPHLSHLAIVRAEDKTRKSRQYRYFTWSSQADRLLQDGLSLESVSASVPMVNESAGELPPVDHTQFINPIVASAMGQSSPMFSLMSPDGMGSVRRKRGRPRKNTQPMLPEPQPVHPLQVVNASPTSAIKKELQMASDLSIPPTPSLLNFAKTNDGLAIASPFSSESLAKMNPETGDVSQLSNVSKMGTPSKDYYSSTSQPVSVFSTPTPAFVQREHLDRLRVSTPPVKRPRLNTVDFLSLQRQTLLLAYLDSQNGVFEVGNHCLEAIADLNMRRNPDAGRTVMDRRTFSGIVTKLIQSKKVRKVVMAFENGAGTLQKREIIIRYDISMDDPRIQQMKEVVKKRIQEQSISNRKPLTVLHDVEFDVLKKSRKKPKPTVAAPVRKQPRVQELNNAQKMKASATIAAKEAKRRSKVKTEKSGVDKVFDEGRRLLESLAPSVEKLTPGSSPALEKSGSKSTYVRQRKDRYALGSDDENEELPMGPLIIKRSVKRLRHDFSSEEDDTLVRAVTITQFFYGGNNRLIKWKAVHKCLPHRPLDLLGRHFTTIRQGDLEPVPENSDEFNPEAYVEASRRPYLLTNNVSSDLNFPESMEELNTRYDIQEIPLVFVPKNHVFDTFVSATSRINAFADTGFIIPSSEITDTNDNDENAGDNKDERQQSELQDQELDNELIFQAKSTIKSIVAIPNDSYDSEFAKSRLLVYPEKVLILAHQELLKNRITSRVHSEVTRLQPGRNFQFTEKFANSIKSLLSPLFLPQANQFSRYLTDGFSAGKSHLLQELSNNGTVGCVLDLLSQRLIDISIVRSKFTEAGITEGYKTRLLERDNINLGLVLTKRADASDPFDSTVTARPPKQEPRLWLDGKAEFIKKIWLEILHAILHQLMRKPGISRAQLAYLLYPGLERREFDEVLNYVIASRAAREDDGLFLNHGYYNYLW